jgi:hypothetical protein
LIIIQSWYILQTKGMLILLQWHKTDFPKIIVITFQVQQFQLFHSVSLNSILGGWPIQYSFPVPVHVYLSPRITSNQHFTLRGQEYPSNYRPVTNT